MDLHVCMINEQTLVPVNEHNVVPRHQTGLLVSKKTFPLFCPLAHFTVKFLLVHI